MLSRLVACVLPTTTTTATAENSLLNRLVTSNVLPCGRGRCLLARWGKGSPEGWDPSELWLVLELASPEKYRNLKELKTTFERRLVGACTHMKLNFLSKLFYAKSNCQPFNFFTPTSRTTDPIWCQCITLLSAIFMWDGFPGMGIPRDEGHIQKCWPR